MARHRVDIDNLTVTGAHRAVQEAHVRVEDDILIIVTQAFGPRGDALMDVSTERFDGYPGIPVLVRAAGREEVVHLSPFHGDRRKTGMEGLEAGTPCELLCPVSRLPLDLAGTTDDGVSYAAIYLTRRLSAGEMIALSTVWDDYRSRVIDNFELISSWSAE